MTPSIPQGTRDFSSETVNKRDYIFNTIRSVFRLYAFEPLETPAMENLETLMGKYGEEGDKLIFKILNNGLSHPSKQETARVEFEQVLEGRDRKMITERALRYDLTIPFARYVAMNHGKINFPFRRYQMQPVWRADRPQRGRYREFYQCDADIVGSHSLLNEVDLINLYADVFERLKVPVTIKFNHRKILLALAEKCGQPDRMMDITVSIDKIDKIGVDKVKEELAGKGMSYETISIIESYLSISGTTAEKLQQIKHLLEGSFAATPGIESIEYILSFFEGTGVEKSLALDFTLARGLNYYTGCIFEVTANDVRMGSIGGGGRYDDLTGLFGVPGIPGVGISFGVDRIYDVMEELNLFPSDLQQNADVLFVNLGNEEARTAYRLMHRLRNKGVSAEIYHDKSKMDKQFRYADKKQIPYVVITGSKEIEEKAVIIKNLKTGQQSKVPFGEIENFSFEGE